jgi:hypothetical protein
MAACGMGGVLMRSMGRMGLVFGKTSRGPGRSFLNKLVLRWGMVRRLDLGMTYGVGIRPGLGL